MINKFLSTIDKYNMISSGDKVLLAVSGGADSVVMLKLFIEAMQKLSVTLEVAHVEHGIRGEASVNDAEFVRSICKKNNIKFSKLSINAPEESRLAGMTVEEYSRKRRYEFFDSLNADKIATAHNADDNAETLIFRLVRGCGINGAASIPAVRGNIIRPLIECTSAEIRAYAVENGIDYRVDSTNSDNKYTRNYIRNVIMPSLKNVNTSAAEHLNEFISDSAEDNDFISQVSIDALSECMHNDKLIISKLKSYHISVIKRVVTLYFKQFDISVDRLHLNEVLLLLDKSGKIQINENDFAISYNDMLYLHKCSEKTPFVIPFFDTISSNDFDNSDVDFFCDYDKIIGKVYFRCRKAGDSISPAGRGCTKTLKKLFNEYKIPEYERGSVPVICDDFGVIGISGYCVDERVKADSSTKTIFYCKIPTED
ncbi:MAG: tRNA lysidine(34) synthetase TilS [Eubacterium sp.]|nr:tRNA lysidine(34) synthetase TilS [Eubacterium sp.]